MQAVCPRKELYEAVQVASRAVSSRSTLPILGHIQFAPLSDGRLRLSATDLEIWLTCETRALIQNALGEEPGAVDGFTAPARVVSEMFASLPDGDVTLDHDSGANRIQVRCARSNFTVLGLAADEFPEPPTFEETSVFSIRGSVLRDMIRQTSFAVATEESRPTLTGVLAIVEGLKLKLVATDTHRLALRDGNLIESNVTESVRAIIPSRALVEISRLATDDDVVRIAFAPSYAQFQLTRTAENDNPRALLVTMITRLIEGQFPNYERVIPTSHTRSLTLETADFAVAVRRVGIVAKENSNRVVLATEGQSLVLSAESGTLGTAREEVEIAREGDDITIAFNAKYLTDVLSVVDTKGVTLTLSEPLRPGILRPLGDSAPETDNEYLCVLMPMQVI